MISFTREIKSKHSPSLLALVFSKKRSPNQNSYPSIIRNKALTMAAIPELFCTLLSHRKPSKTATKYLLTLLGSSPAKILDTASKGRLGSCYSAKF